VVPSSAKLAATGEVQRSHGDLLSETMPVVTHPGYSKQDTGGGCVRELMKEGFTRDLLVVIALTVLLGASVTSGVAYAVNAYLAQQVTGVLGDLGEYDLILHVREESCDAARAEIDKVISAGFKGAHVKEGPVVLGKSNFFVALPDQLRSRPGLENLAKLLGEVPGASGVTFIIEPRLTLTGIESGAFYFLLNQAEEIKGVRFCFRDGGRIAVVLEPDANIRQVSNDLTALVESYRAIEVRFPIGREMEDREASGEAYVDKLTQGAGASYARDITRRGGNSDLADLSATLAEMKRFLRHYAAYANISIAGDTPLKAGDTVLLLPDGIPSPTQASPASSEEDSEDRDDSEDRAEGLLVLVDQVEGNTARGMVTQGDTDEISESELLAVPCSGQLGVIVGMLSQRPLALAIWVVSISAVFIMSGFAAKKLIPGEKAVFVMEVPPLRMPVISNVVTKTMVRMKWYFAEIIPIFIGTSLLIWVGRITGLLNVLISYLRIPILILGLPEETAFAFLFGFLRRDYGAAGLYDLFRLGRLNGVQLVVACVVLTLFVPCVAQFAVMWKERGGLAAVVIAAGTIVIAFATGVVLNMALTWLELMP
jgi:spore maturation protein SpmB